jgi:hypothetical protein
MCESIENIKENWDKLKATYQQIDLATQVTSYIKLTEIHMAKNANAIEFLNEFQCHIDDVIIIC